ncbi:hypothetical protein CHARACLAT_013442, partial [Characodon lateralis]|nr:hypothetical protein [Characodon lateralis]
MPLSRKVSRVDTELGQVLFCLFLLFDYVLSLVIVLLALQLLSPLEISQMPQLLHLSLKGSTADLQGSSDSYTALQSQSVGATGFHAVLQSSPNGPLHCFLDSFSVITGHCGFNLPAVHLNPVFVLFFWFLPWSGPEFFHVKRISAVELSRSLGCCCRVLSWWPISAMDEDGKVADGEDCEEPTAESKPFNKDRLVLYHWTQSFSSQKVRLVIHEKGLVCDERDVSLPLQEHKEPWFMRLNLGEEVPVFLHGDTIISDYNQMVDYMEKNFVG